MDENLIGYLVGSLDEETHCQVERHLENDTEARERLDRLKAALEPLSYDAAVEEPPSGLWLKTLAFIAHDQCRPAPEKEPASPFKKLPTAPKTPWSDSASPKPTTWRWMDVAAVAAILVVSVSLGLLGLNHFWRDEIQLSCQNNLRVLHQALVAYSDKHQGEFPKVSPTPPDNVAGIYLPILKSEGVLPNSVHLNCPGREGGPTVVPTMEELRRMTPEEFTAFAQKLGGSYAYSLGYGQPDNLTGLRSDDDQRLPILADRPTYIGKIGTIENSANHGGRGQNVLFVDGHVQFFVTHTIGVDRDDIFLNREGRIAAGQHRFDSVLGSSAARPFPVD